MSDDNADKLTRLEEEGEIAADYLEELLDIADLDGDIEIDVENGRASVEIVADDPDALDRLVGDGIRVNIHSCIFFQFSSHNSESSGLSSASASSGPCEPGV